jgi:serine/threonine protein kinase
MDLSASSQFFVSTRALGESGYGSVSLGGNTSDPDSRYAIKVFLYFPLKDIENEALAMRLLSSNPYIVHTYGFVHNY